MPTGKRIKQVEKDKIKDLYNNQEWTMRDIATHMNVGMSSVHRIVNGLTRAKSVNQGDRVWKQRTRRVFSIKPETERQPTVSTSAYLKDHDLIKEYADKNQLPRHEALNELLRPEVAKARKSGDRPKLQKDLSKELATVKAELLALSNEPKKGFWFWRR